MKRVRFIKARKLEFIFSTFLRYFAGDEIPIDAYRDKIGCFYNSIK